MNCIDTRDTTVKNCTFASGCCMMIKANTFKVVGLLDEDYFMYCEDTEFCIRLLKNGIRIKYIPTAKLWHKVSQSTGGSDSAFSTYYMTRNRLNYIKKYCNEFSWTAYPFSLLTRYIRMITCKDKKKKQAFRQGIHDHIKAVTGKVSPYL
jgi:GT2 family glycosyltransferase